MTIEQAIEHAEEVAIEQAIAQYEQFANVCEHHGLTASKEEFEQLAAWLRELMERRKAPEIVRCGECELKLVCCRTIRSEGRRDDDFCSCGIREERRSDETD